MAAEEGCKAGSGMSPQMQATILGAGSRWQSAHTVPLLSMRSFASSSVGSGAFSLRFPKMRFMLPASTQLVGLYALRWALPSGSHSRQCTAG